MFKFTYFDSQIKSILSDRNTFCDLAVEQELNPVLEVLKQTGEVEGAYCGFKPGVSGLVYELKGKTFRLTYAVDVPRKEIKFYEFQQISHSIDWKTLQKRSVPNRGYNTVGYPISLTQARKVAFQSKTLYLESL